MTDFKVGDRVRTYGLYEYSNIELMGTVAELPNPNVGDPYYLIHLDEASADVYEDDEVLRYHFEMEAI